MVIKTYKGSFSQWGSPHLTWFNCWRWLNTQSVIHDLSLSILSWLPDLLFLSQLWLLRATRYWAEFKGAKFLCFWCLEGGLGWLRIIKQVVFYRRLDQFFAWRDKCLELLSSFLMLITLSAIMKILHLWRQSVRIENLIFLLIHRILLEASIFRL